MTKKAEKRYYAWKTKPDGHPIAGTEKIYTGKSARDVLAHIAYEEGVPHQREWALVRLPNGERWCVAPL